MGREAATYYWISDQRIIGKSVHGRDYLFDSAECEWRIDRARLISDRRIGYDDAEPPDSPYATGSTDMLEKMKIITREMAMQFMMDHSPKEKKMTNNPLHGGSLEDFDGSIKRGRGFVKENAGTVGAAVASNRFNE